MGFAGADCADDQQSAAVARIVFLNEPRDGQAGEFERWMRIGKVRGIAGEFAVLVSAGDAGGSKYGFNARVQLAIAASDSALLGRGGGCAVTITGNGLPAGAVT